MSEAAVKKYVVRLSAEERQTLAALISKGKHPAALVLKARILLKADVSEAGEGWSDSRIVKALDVSPATIYRSRQRRVEEGFEAVLAWPNTLTRKNALFAGNDGGAVHWAIAMTLIQTAKLNPTGLDLS
jgi:hypothetical protein